MVQKGLFREASIRESAHLFESERLAVFDLVGLLLESSDVEELIEHLTALRFEHTADVIEVDLGVEVALHKCSVFVIFDVLAEAGLREEEIGGEALFLEIFSGHVISIRQKEENSFLTELALKFVHESGSEALDLVLRIYRQEDDLCDFFVVEWPVDAASNYNGNIECFLQNNHAFVLSVQCETHYIFLGHLGQLSRHDALQVDQLFHVFAILWVASFKADYLLGRRFDIILNSISPVSSRCLIRVSRFRYPSPV